MPLSIHNAALSQVTSEEVEAAYRHWQRQFLRRRLRLGLCIAILSVFTFILLKISFYQNNLSWATINITEIGLLLTCLALAFSPVGRYKPVIIMLLFSWSITTTPLFWGWFSQEARLDYLTWTLMFVGQATLAPVHWRAHLFSQLVTLFYFFWLHLGLNMPVQTYIVEANYVYLYLFWLCLICNLSVYLYERLQRAEFRARMTLEAEKLKTEQLLLNILPHSIAERLKQSPTTIADDFKEVTVLFADIVGFTDLSSRLMPTTLVEMLNDVFSEFDKLVEKHKLEKIKTIGDAYMVVAGLPLPQADHTERMANLALEMQAAIQSFNQSDYHSLNIRIGIHSGPVVAGVIGIRKFAYDLWGDTVNIASRMESHGIKGCIQVSEQVYDILKDSYQLEARGDIEVKGKGNMKTFLLNGPKNA